MPPPKKKVPPPPKTPPPPPPADTGEQKSPPASEKICASIPTYPGCEQLSSQEESNLGAPQGGDIRVPSICEQNPQLPDCQPDQPTPPTFGETRPILEPLPQPAPAEDEQPPAAEDTPPAETGQPQICDGGGYFSIDGICVPEEDWTYENTTEKCVKGDAFSNRGPGFIDITREKQCELYTELICYGRGDRNDSMCRGGPDEVLFPPADAPPFCDILGKQVLVDGECLSQSDIGYDDAIEICVSLSNTGINAEECADYIADKCIARGSFADRYLYCRELADEDQPPHVNITPPTGEQPPADEGVPPPPVIVTPPRPTAPGTPTVRLPVDTIARYNRRTTSQPPLAIVIANALYASDLIPASPHAVGGAAAFTRYLVDGLGLPASRIISQRNMSRGNFIALFGKPNATAGFLKNILKTTPASELIIYYSGRAMAVDGGKDAVLLTRNARIDRPGQTGYRLSMLYRQLAKLGVKRLRLYLDTAFSNPLDAQPGAGSSPVKPVQSTPKIGPRGIFTPRKWIVMSASSDNQPAYVNPQRPISAFSNILIAGLRGSADISVNGNKNGAVTAGELNAFITDNLQELVQGATRGTQRPVLSGRKSEILATVQLRELKPAPAAPTPAPPVRLPQSGAIKPSFNCARAATPTEKTICANPAIATLDNVMAGLFNKARRARHGAARRALQAQQKNWRKQRNACGSDIACLAQRYGERIGQLQ